MFWALLILYLVSGMSHWLWVRDDRDVHSMNPTGQLVCFGLVLFLWPIVSLLKFIKPY